MIVRDGRQFAIVIIIIAIIVIISIIIVIIKSRWVDGEMIVRDGREEEGWRELEGILDKK